MLALGKTEKLLLYSHQRFYECANKASTLLAKMLRDDAAQRFPYSLRKAKGAVTYDSGEIAKIRSVSE